MPHVTCHVSHVICHMSCVTCHMSHVMCHMSQVMCYMSHVTCNMSPVTCHMLHITCHLSHVTFFVSHVTCQVELVGGRCVSNGAYSVNIFFKHLLFLASFSGNGCLGPSPLKKKLCFGVPTTIFHSISVSPTTAHWTYPPSQAWATRAVVRDTQMAWNMFVGTSETDWNLVVGDPEMEWNLVVWDTQGGWNPNPNINWNFGQILTVVTPPFKLCLP